MTPSRGMMQDYSQVKQFSTTQYEQIETKLFKLLYNEVVASY